MPEIIVLDKNTIDQIAAGEVVDRPSSVVKELVENAVDAKATAITVEIREGGISLVRVTDNGCGIAEDQIRIAFARHSTSKIRSAPDLLSVSSLGFRGEALSSIASVAQVELITKTNEQLTGCRYLIEGGEEKLLEEVGVPNGTTFLVKNLFYNTPARRKFLKSAAAEAGYISDLMERMALSNPEVSFKFINNGQVRLHTSGSGNVKDIIYHVYGRDIAANLLEVSREFEHFSVHGFIGKPVISRGNRNYESYFVNGRYVKDRILAKAIEDGYKGFMMQHKYPFTVLYLTMQGDQVDVNVHPAKMELRLSNGEEIYWKLSGEIAQILKGKELILQTAPGSGRDAGGQTGSADKRAAQKEEKKKESEQNKAIPEPFEQKRLEAIRKAVAKDSPYEKKYGQRAAKKDPDAGRQTDNGKGMAAAAEKRTPAGGDYERELRILDDGMQTSKTAGSPGKDVLREKLFYGGQEPDRQIKLWDLLPEEERRLLDAESVPDHKIIGQLFETYWLVEFEDKLYMIDQHAAHEKVLYERLMENYRKKEFTSQQIVPPVILSLTLQEEALLKRYLPQFTQLGFEIEPFGGKEYAVRALPDNLYGLNGKELLLELLDGLGDIPEKDAPQLVLEKVALMSCRAAVKGNMKLSKKEAEALIAELLTLENPYHCPHGRPVIISMSRYEIEKKFKRIV